MYRYYALLLLLPTLAHGAEGWTPQQMLQVKRIGGVYPSPDGKRVAYTVREAVMDDLRSEVVTQIHLADADGGNPLQLTRNYSNDVPQWSPDGKSIAFASTRSGKANIWLIQTVGGEAEQVTDVKSGVSGFQWSPDGQLIAFTAVDPPSLAEEVAAHIKADVKIMDEDVKHMRLYVTTAKADGKGKRLLRPLTLEKFSVTSDGFDWSPDSKTIAFAHTKTTKADDWPSSDISLVDIESAKVKTLLASSAAETMPKYSRDGKWIAFVRTDEPPTWAQHGYVHLVSPKTGDQKVLAATPDMKPTILGWSADNQSIICGENSRTKSQLFVLPLNDSPRPFSNWEGIAASGFNLCRDGTVGGVAWEWTDKPPEAFITKMDEFDPVVVSRVNQKLPKLPFGQTEVITWKSTDGLPIEGMVTYPVGYRKGERYPLLLVIHGGPAGVFSQTFIANQYPYPVAAFASNGYVVLRANPRGSSGYGKEFRYANYKDWGGHDYQDLMTGVDHLITLGVADEKRMGVMGWSYGGFMTSWIITQTKRFKAASVGAGVTNLVSFTGTADIPGFLPDYFGGEFWGGDQIYRDHSPIFRARGVTTPTLIQHGAADERVPLSQGLEFYNALKRQGCTVKMAVYPRMPHAINEPRLLLDAMQRNLRWFDEHVKGETPKDVAKVPTTRTDNVKETLHGVELVDPYRWLEDKDSPETRKWLEAQEKYSRSVIDPLPGRDALSKRFGELLKIDNMTTPEVRGGRWFYSKRRADQDQPVWYVRDGLDGKEEVLLDVNTLSDDKMTSVSSLDISDDGKVWLYGLRKGGEDEVTVKSRFVDSKQDSPVLLPRGRYFGVHLTPDKQGLYYSRMNKDGPRVYFKRLHEAEGREVFGKGYGPDKIISISMPENQKYLLMTVSYGSAATKSDVFVLKLPNEELLTVVNDLPARFNGRIGGDTLFLQTNWVAPNNRIFAIDLNKPARDQWKEVVPEQKNVMQSFAAIGGNLYVTYLEDAVTRVKKVQLNQRINAEHAVGAPAPTQAFGTVTISGRWDAPDYFWTFTSFVQPSAIHYYRRVGDGNTFGTLWSANVPLKGDDFDVKQVRYKSKDGTEIPMFLVHKKGLKLDGNNPVFLTGYGGFNLSRTPQFAAAIALWCEQGGVYALPSLRGGGEFGEAWHKAGMLEKKQNVFDDFIGAAEWLIQQKYTRPEKLAIAGGSNGGLLVGAAMTQRPELFRAVLCAVPLLDMVRYHKFLVARFWVPEYGSAEKLDQFKFIHAYSPYQHVKKGEKYPGVMFVTGDADTRVDPLHARKMCALMQANTGSGPDRPVLLHYDTKAGHSQGKPVSKQIDDLVDEYAFLFWQLGVTVK